MPKKITAALTYDASPEEVFAMFSDEAFVREKNERTGGENVEVSVEDKNGGIVATASRDFSLAGRVPGFVTSMVGETIGLTQVDVWHAAQSDASRDGTMDVQFKGKPANVSGRIRLEANGSGTKFSTDLQIKVSIPLVGGKAEGVLAEQFQRAVEAEEAIGREWLANH